MEKIKLVQVMNAVDSLRKLSVSELPLKLSYKLSKITQACQVEIDFYEDKRLELAEKYGTLNDDKTSYNVVPEKAEEVQKLLIELGDLEIQNDIPSLELSLDLDLKLTPNDVALLEPFITFI